MNLHQSFPEASGDLPAASLLEDDYSLADDCSQLPLQGGSSEEVASGATSPTASMPVTPRGETMEEPPSHAALEKLREVQETRDKLAQLSKEYNSLTGAEDPPITPVNEHKRMLESPAEVGTGEKRSALGQDKRPKHKPGDTTTKTRDEDTLLPKLSENRFSVRACRVPK